MSVAVLVIFYSTVAILLRKIAPSVWNMASSRMIPRSRSWTSAFD